MFLKELKNFKEKKIIAITTKIFPKIKNKRQQNTEEIIISHTIKAKQHYFVRQMYRIIFYGLIHEIIFSNIEN